MNITQQSIGAIPVIRVDGTLDRPGAASLEEALSAHARAADRRMILDLSNCPHVHGDGLAAIMNTVGELRDDRLMAIVAPSVSVRRLLDTVGLYERRRCTIFKNERDALSTLGLASCEMES